MRVPFALLSAPAWLAVLTDAPWTYIVLGASAIVTEELAPIFGGIAAHEGELRLMAVVVAITLGGWMATALLYLLGRLKWEAIRRRFPKVRATGTVALRVVRRNPMTASFFVRFAFGLRIVLPMACGAARVPLYRYLPMTLLGSLAWTAVFTAVGYAAGEAAVQAIGHLGQAGEIVGAIVLTGAILAFVKWQRTRRARKAARQAAVPPATPRSTVEMGSGGRTD
ncbi:MAG: DedA family protein [Gemmatimonas sp.]|jgi:membrane protein DedA with SNARE-associated domain|uniref:DedA family protein n=1 Tax=Gemmatimonas sp. TaxID=1962908 RepID=UPI00391FAA71|nr:DedA family protein [Gemmatimonadota bacterium]